MPTISIIIPCYNSFSLMAPCLDSLEKQTYRDFEVIAIDDCSKDDTYKKLEDYADSALFKMTVLKNNSNSGPGPTKNAGISKAVGEFLLFLDSDDYIEYETLALLMKAQQINDVDCVIFDYFLDRNSRSFSRSSLQGNAVGLLNNMDALVFSNGSTCGKLYRKQIIEYAGITFPKLMRAEDIAFTKQAIAACGSIYHLKKCLYHYVMQKNSLIHNRDLLSEENASTAYQLIEDALQKSFPEEILAIYIKESFYSRVMTKLALGVEKNVIISYIKSCELEHKNWSKNKYIKNFSLNQRICLFFIKFQFLWGLKVMLWLKNKILMN